MAAGGILLVVAIVRVFSDDGGGEQSRDTDAAEDICAFPACRAAATQALARGFEGQSVAVNPANPNHVVVTDANMTTAHCTWHVTFDGGKEWTDGVFQTPSGYTGCHINSGSGGHVPTGHSGVAFGPSGTVYATFGSAHTEDAERESVMIGRSSDGGKKFDVTVAARPPAEDPGYARPQLSVAPGAGARDRVLISFAQCRDGGRVCEQAVLARSDDGGASFSAPVTVNDPPAGQTPSPPVQTADGTVYVAFMRRYADGLTDLVLGRSADGGATFGNYTLIDRQPVLGDRHDRANLAIDPRTNAMYVVYTDARIGRQQVVFRKSTDNGMTWGAAVGLSPDEAAAGTARSPALAVAPNGRIDITYYRTLQPDNDDVFWAHSVDGGGRFVFRQVNESPIRRFPYAAAIGNWYPPDVASADDAAFVVWSDTRNAPEQDENVQDVFLRRMPAAAEDAPP